MTSAVEAPVLANWRNPELWPPRGLGCGHCHTYPPIVFALDFGALCERCLALCFPGWPWDRLEDWLVRQRELRLRLSAAQRRPRGRQASLWAFA